MAKEELLVTLGMNANGFKKEMREINKDLTSLEKEFKTSEGAINSYEDKAEGLTNALGKAGQVLEQYSNKLTKLRNRVTENVSDHDKLINKQNELTQALNKAQSEFNQLSQEQQKNSTEGKELSSTIRKIEQELNRTNTAINKNETEYNQLQREISETETKTQSFEQKVGSLQRELNTFNTDKATNELEQLSKGQGLENFANGLQGMGQVAQNTGRKILGAYREIIDKGSELSAQTQQTEFLFNRLPKSTQNIINANKENAKSIGLTAKQYTNVATSIATFGQGMGLVGKDLDNFTDKQAQLTADMSAFADVPVEQALGDIKSAMMGNFEALDKYQIDMKVSTINNSEFAKSLGKTWDKMTEQEKALAIQSTLMQKSAHMTGFAKEEAGQFGKQVLLLKANLGDLIENAFKKIEPALTPVVTKMAEVVEAVSMWVEQNPELAKMILLVVGAIGIFLTAIGGIASFIAPIIMSITGLVTAYGSLAGAMTAIGGAVSSFMGILLPAVAVIAGVALAITLAWDDIKASVQYVIEFCQPYFEMMKTAFMDLWNVIQSVWETVGKPVFTILGQVIAEVIRFVAPLFGLFATAFKIAVDVIKSVWNNVLQPVFSFLVSIIQKVWSVAQPIFRQLSSLFASVCNLISSVWNSVGKPVFDKVMSIFKSVFNTAKQFLEPMGAVVSSVFSGIGSAVSGVIGFFESLVNSIKSVVRWLSELIGKAKDGVIGKIASWFGRSIEPLTVGVQYSMPNLVSPRAMMALSNVGTSPLISPMSVESKTLSRLTSIGTLAGAIGNNDNNGKSPKGRGRDEDDKPVTKVTNINVAELVVREEADIQRIAEALKKLEEEEERGRGRIRR